MKRKERAGLTLLTIVAGMAMVTMSNCSSDEPAKKSAVGFTAADVTVNEGIGTVSIEVGLESPLAKDSELNFSLSGTATAIEDYELASSISIAKGATSATIEINIIDDLAIEDDETIIVTLTSGTQSLQLGDEKVFTINVVEDDMIVQLSWDSGDGTAGNVDMDLFIWSETTPGSQEFEIINFSLQIGTAFELAHIPSSFDDGLYGMSYVYYEGTSDALTVTSTFFNLGGLLDESAEPISFDATYSQLNINVWDDETIGSAPIIVQVMDKSGLDYENFTDILVPNEKSRVSVPVEKIRELIRTKMRN